MAVRVAAREGDPASGPEPPPTGLEPGAPDLGGLRQVALFLERVNLAEWVAIMNDPRRSFRVNFWAGVARGIGMVVGAALTGLVFALFSASLLKKAFIRAGGVPWVGAEMREAVGFVLRVVRDCQARQ